MFISSLLLILLAHNAISLQCVDHENNPVDWYVLYKFPIIKKNPNKLIRGGVGYAFMTSNEASTWKLSSVSIKDANSIPGLTLGPLYQRNEQVWHISYNDEPPNKSTNSKKGHTKGVVLGNDSEGLWLVHSVPKFPPISEENYSYPLTGTEFGQSFLCISLDINNLNNVGIQLQYNEPDIYSQNVPYLYKATHPDIYKASIDVTVQTVPGFNTLDLISKGGTTFKSFAKNRNFGADLYKDLVAPALKDVTLLVETWPNGPGRMPSNCTGEFGVKNVDQISFEALAPNAAFKSTHDHSKWALGFEEKYICIGDINRATTQKKRGGGTVCIKHDNLAQSYKNVVNLVENC